MKRALSFILALTLAFALLPSFASAVDMEPAELTEFTVNFNGANTDEVTPNSDSTTRWFVLEGESLAGTNWSVLTDTAYSNILNRNTGKTKNAIQYFTQSGENYISLTTKSTDIDHGYDTAAIKIIVPADGVYNLSSRVWGSSSGGYAEVSVDGKSFGKVCLNGEVINTKKQQVSFDEAVFLTAGEHILTIKNSLYPNVSTPSNGFFSFTFTGTDTKVNNSVSFVQTTNVDGHNDITVKSVMRGDSVALTAHKEEIDGYEFVGWKRGSNDDNSAWIDIDGDSYNVWTNTFLTAIYKPVGETAAATVDFWNQNGAYLGQAKEATYTAALEWEPTLTGFGTFRGWFMGENVQLPATFAELNAGTTNAVAQYEDKVVSGVKRDDSAVEDGDVKDGFVYYNEAITFEKKNASSTCWMRDDNIISYDDTYTYNVWGATNITEGTATNPEKPVAILEYNEGYKAYMFEYDDCGYTIAEAGIIFGSESATVDICEKKYTSQRKVSHNQFTVPAESGTAKGYIIWKDASGAYQIDYFSVNQ